MVLFTQPLQRRGFGLLLQNQTTKTRTIMKKQLLLLAVLCLVAAQARGQEVTDSGTCGAEGDNITWTWIESSGLLLISGTGEMTYDGDVPWANYRGRIQTAIITAGVTSIGENAFYCGTRLTSVTIPSSVTSIERQAFYQCTDLASINIPENVTSIGASAFCGCSSLASVTIPESVTSIGVGAFYGTGLYNNKSNWTDGALYMDRCLIEVDGETVAGAYNIVPGTRLIADCAFSVCNNLISVEIPNSVISIGDYGIHQCNNLTSVNIGDGVTSIGNDFLANCSSLTSVTIPNSVTSIGDRFLLYCDSLTSVTIPNSVTSIGEECLSRCGSLTSVDIPDGVTSIGGGVLSYCYKLTSVWIGSGLETMSLTATTGFCSKSLEGSTNLEVFVCKSAVAKFPVGLLQGLPNLRRVEGPANLLEYENNEDLYTYTTRLDSVTITGGTVSDKGFAVLRRSADALETLSLEGADNTELPTLALDGCLRLRNLVLPASLTRTGYGAFKECTALASVTLPASLAEVGDRAFEDCYLLSDITWNEGLQRIGDRAFYGCNSLPQVAIPEGVEYIGVAAFMGCTYMEDVQLPASLRTIGDNAFAHNTRTRSMTVHATVPPLVSAHTFYQLDASAPVYVPAESLASYRAAAYWQDLNLQPIGSTTGIAAPSLAERITVKDGEVHINIIGMDEVRVYDLQGRHVLSTTESRFTLPQGVYIVQVGNEAVKLSL